jgi:hypothetical protein
VRWRRGLGEVEEGFGSVEEGFGSVEEEFGIGGGGLR